MYVTPVIGSQFITRLQSLFLFQVDTVSWATSTCQLFRVKFKLLCQFCKCDLTSLVVFCYCWHKWHWRARLRLGQWPLLLSWRLPPPSPAITSQLHISKKIGTKFIAPRYPSWDTQGSESHSVEPSSSGVRHKHCLFWQGNPDAEGTHPVRWQAHASVITLPHPSLTSPTWS